MYVCMRLYECTYVYMHPCMHVHTHTHTQVYAYTMHVSVHTCTCILTVMTFKSLSSRMCSLYYRMCSLTVTTMHTLASSPLSFHEPPVEESTRHCISRFPEGMYCPEDRKESEDPKNPAPHLPSLPLSHYCTHTHNR